MDENLLRYQILKAAYDKHIGYSQPFANVIRQSAYERKNGYEEGELTRVFEYLIDKGYLEIRLPGGNENVDYVVSITAKGIDFIEGPGPFNPVSVYNYVENAELDQRLKEEFKNILEEIKNALNDAANKNEKLKTKAPLIAEFLGKTLGYIINTILNPNPQ